MVFAQPCMLILNQCIDYVFQVMACLMLTSTPHEVPGPTDGGCTFVRPALLCVWRCARGANSSTCILVSSSLSWRAAWIFWGCGHWCADIHVLSSAPWGLHNRQPKYSNMCATVSCVMHQKMDMCPAWPSGSTGHACWMAKLHQAGC